MKLPEDRDLQELLALGKDLENRARKVYQMSEALAQKCERQFSPQSQSSQPETTSKEK